MSKGMTVRVEGAREIVDKLQKLGVNLERAQELILTAGAEVVRDAAADTVRGDSTKIADSIHIETLSRTPGKVEVGVAPDKKRWYAIYLERGTRPHQVKAKGKALKFAGNDGGWAFRKSIMHPGIKPRPFMQPAADEHHSEILSEMAAKGAKVVEAST